MRNSINTMIYIYRNNLVNLINSTQLPLSVVQYVTKDILNEVMARANDELQLELKEPDEKPSNNVPSTMTAVEGEVVNETEEVHD